jgi:hypothetical protein
MTLPAPDTMLSLLPRGRPAVEMFEALHRGLAGSDTMRVTIAEGRNECCQSSPARGGQLAGWPPPVARGF